MRPSAVFWLFLAAASALFVSTWLHATSRSRHAAEGLASRSRIVSDHALTDLSLFTEARYTRHPSQADLHSAFQTHPLALEHFPSGSLVPPPPTLPR
jgi:hypothetical protein